MEISLVVEALRIPGLVARLLADLAGAWASVALLVAGFAAFLGFLSRSKIPRVGYSRSRSVISLPSLCYFTSDDDDDIDSESPSDDEEDNDEAPSSPSSSSSSGEYESVSDWGHEGGLELAMSGAVVRTWEGLGVGFGHSGGQISLMDLDRGEVLRSFHAQAPAAAASLASPAVVVSAAEGPTAVRVWDARAAGERTPAAAVEWRSIRQRRVVGVAGGEGRVYVGGDDGVITAADLRRGRSPLVVEAWRGGRWPVLPSPSE